MRLCFLIAFMVLLPTISEGGVCRSTADCYCKLLPSGCDILVNAEVLDKNENEITIKVIGAPHYDPFGHFFDSIEIGHVKWMYEDPSVGDRGLMKIDIAQPCDEEIAEMTLIAMVLDTNGKYLCDLDPSFSGAELGEVLSAVLAGNMMECRTRVFEFGVQDIECPSSMEEGCCSSTTASLGNSLFLCFLGIALAARKITVRKY